MRLAKNFQQTDRYLRLSRRISVVILVLSGCIASSAFAQQTSTVCSFTRGPKAGTTHDYAPMAPLPVGTSCWDGVSSYGVVGNSPAPISNQMSTVCSFTRGPKAGTTHDYAPMAPLKVGSSCWDGVDSYGTVIAGSSTHTPPQAIANPQSQPSPQSQMSTVCSFTRGPKAGTTHDYAPMAPMAVGTPCQDGQESFGIVQ
jgi:hypothetical protein